MNIGNKNGSILPKKCRNGNVFQKKVVKSNQNVLKYTALKMDGKLKGKKEQSFEEAFAELQDILRELNGQNVALDKLVEKYSKAKSCLEICRKRLSEAEMQVKTLGVDGLEDFEK